PLRPRAARYDLRGGRDGLPRVREGLLTAIRRVADPACRARRRDRGPRATARRARARAGLVLPLSATLGDRLARLAASRPQPTSGRALCASADPPEDEDAVLFEHEPPVGIPAEVDEIGRRGQRRDPVEVARLRLGG